MAIPETPTIAATAHPTLFTVPTQVQHSFFLLILFLLVIFIASFILTLGKNKSSPKK